MPFSKEVKPTFLILTAFKKIFFYIYIWDSSGQSSLVSKGNESIASQIQELQNLSLSS